MKKLEDQDIKTLLNNFDELLKSGKSKQEALVEIKGEILAHLEKKAVLGFDIYRYSQYPLLEQSLIPYLFKKLYVHTCNNCINHEPYIFQNYKLEDFTKTFIDSGDGGFQIFETPLHAVIFAIYFQSNIKRYNSGREPVLLQLKEIIGEITLRYAVSYDSVYSFKDNFYGPSIINNARIMEKDKLNRCLIDDNTSYWFTEELNGIENLQLLNYDDLKGINIFKKYKDINEKASLLFNSSRSNIISSQILKIGEIKSKLDTLSIHSIHIQTRMTSAAELALNKYTVSLGNLNSTGIAE